jgi:AICAR transformylase/IMP cyclohydrolase PurH
MPPLAGGQVKTYPGGLRRHLARRDRPEQLTELAEQGMGTFDIVVVNVRPFAPQAGARMWPIDEAIEMIDVGGLALLSAAARNFAGVAAISDPAQYAQVVEEIGTLGHVSPELRQRLAAEAFALVAAYDAEVAAYLDHIAGTRFPRRLTLVLEKQGDLPYGENPHQRGALYRETSHRAGTLADAARLQGATPTFNDLLDLDAAHRITADFTAPTVAIVKRANPVGLASADTLLEAYQRALETDPVNAFGSTVGVNRTLDEATATAIVANAYETVVAPGYDDEAASSWPEAGAGRPGHPGHARGRHLRLRHRRPRYRAHRRRHARRDPRSGRRPACGAARRDHPTAHPRGADRSDVRLACGAPRDQQRGSPRVRAPSSASERGRPVGSWRPRSPFIAPPSGPR